MGVVIVRVISMGDQGISVPPPPTALVTDLEKVTSKGSMRNLTWRDLSPETPVSTRAVNMKLTVEALEEYWILVGEITSEEASMLGETLSTMATPPPPPVDDDAAPVEDDIPELDFVPALLDTRFEGSNGRDDAAPVGRAVGE